MYSRVHTDCVFKILSTKLLNSGLSGNHLHIFNCSKCSQLLLCFLYLFTFIASPVIMIIELFWVTLFIDAD